MLTLHWSFPFKCHNLALILCFLRPEKTCMLSGHLAVGAPSLLSCLYQGFWGLSGPRSPHISPGGAPTVTSVKQPQSRESGWTPRAPLVTQLVWLFGHLLDPASVGGETTMAYQYWLGCADYKASPLPAPLSVRALRRALQAWPRPGSLSGKPPVATQLFVL